MTERDPIESLEAADGLPVAPSPEFEEELRIVLDLRPGWLRQTPRSTTVGGRTTSPAAAIAVTGSLLARSPLPAYLPS